MPTGMGNPLPWFSDWHRTNCEWCHVRKSHCGAHTKQQNAGCGEEPDEREKTKAKEAIP